MKEVEQNIIVVTPKGESNAVNAWGFSLGTGYPWYAELGLTLVVVGLAYFGKKHIDSYFQHREEKRKQKITDRYYKKYGKSE